MITNFQAENLRSIDAEFVKRKIPYQNVKCAELQKQVRDTFAPGTYPRSKQM